MKETKVYIALAFVLMLATVLRVAGLSWGIPTPEVPHFPLHWDEWWALNNIQHMNWQEGDFNPFAAHREGTLAYYVWCAVAVVSYLVGLLPQLPWRITGFGPDYAALLYLGRLTTVVCDLASIVLVFLAARLISHSSKVGVLAALVLAVTPFAAVHAHYLRTHSLSNTMMMATIVIALPLATHLSFNRLLLAGVFAGLTAATRYPVGGIIIVPQLLLIYAILASERSATKAFRARLREVILAEILLLAGFVFGLLIADPYLFLDFSGVQEHFKGQAEYIDASQFSLSSFFDLSKTRGYLTYIIPHGAYPALWLLYYLAMIYGLCLRRYWKHSLPLYAFAFAYFFVMAKGYAFEVVFVRPVLALFPIGAILTALTVVDLHTRMAAANKRIAAAAVVGLVALCVASSAAFTMAYVSEMGRSDPRLRFYDWLSDVSKSDQQLTIGLYPYCRNFLTIYPVLNVLPHPHLEREERTDFSENPGKVDYVVLTAFDPPQFPEAEQRVEKLTTSGHFVLAKVFQADLSFLGVHFSNKHFPHDMQYPFPSLYVLKRNDTLQQQ